MGVWGEEPDLLCRQRQDSGAVSQLGPGCTVGDSDNVSQNGDEKNPRISRPWSANQVSYGGRGGWSNRRSDGRRAMVEGETFW